MHTQQSDLSPTRRRLAVLLLREERKHESIPLFRAELESSADGEKWLSDLIVRAMELRNLTWAGDLAAILIAVQRGSQWNGESPASAPAQVRDAYISAAKLRHDIDQFRYLRKIGVLDCRFDEVIRAYEKTIERHADLGNNRARLTAEDEQQIGDFYGRIVHVADAPRVHKALSSSWNAANVERLYRQRPGVVVIDNFLTPEALGSVYRFCLESTVWSGNRYAHGRLGAFFFSGFNAPLLLQIAEEIRDVLPGIIGMRHPLRQLWAFKNTAELPANSTIHADFAAVNVNFWITPTSANLDDSSGGMLIYEADAPLSWDFATYNERVDVIREYLSAQQPGVIRIPYRQNRAIIFNSDLFHATEAVRFWPEYENHRVNVTMLYGDRRLDDNHPQSRASGSSEPAIANSWRSAAFSRSRR